MLRKIIPPDAIAPLHALPARQMDHQRRRAIRTKPSSRVRLSGDQRYRIRGISCADKPADLHRGCRSGHLAGETHGCSQSQLCRSCDPDELSAFHPRDSEDKHQYYAHGPPSIYRPGMSTGFCTRSPNRFYNFTRMSRRIWKR